MTSTTDNIDVRIDNLIRWISPSSNVTNPPLTQSSPFINSKVVVKDINESGRGLYAKDNLNKGEILMNIPPSFLLNSTTVIRHITRHNESIKLTEPHYLNIKIPTNFEQDKFTDVYTKLAVKELSDLSSFQLISLYLTFEVQRKDKSYWKPFLDLLPQLKELDCTPFIWKVLNINHYQELFNLLPKSTQKHTDKVYQRFIEDYQVVKRLITGKLEIDERYIETDYLPLELYLWSWICINSRCLYMKLPQSKNSSDNFTMVPYADFLNHSSDDKCGIKIDVNGFKVITNSKYSTNDQLLFSYGPHSNEFLLCEYGFTLSQNKWNYLDISNFIIPLLKPKQIEFLKEFDYFDDYTITESSGISFRTEIAFATLQEPLPKESTRLKSLINGIIDGKVYSKTTNILLSKILEKVIHDCDNQKFLEFVHNDELMNKKRAIGDLYRDRKNIALKTLQDINITN